MSIAIANKWSGHRTPRLFVPTETSTRLSVYVNHGSLTVDFSESVMHGLAPYIDVSWGDGTSTRYTDRRVEFSHTYATAGIYDIVITDSLVMLGFPIGGGNLFSLRSVTELGSRVSSVQRVSNNAAPKWGVETLSGFRKSSVTQLPDGFMSRVFAAEGSTALADLSWLPRGISEIPRSAFERCEFLTSLDGMPDVVAIRESAFKGCTSLTSLDGAPSTVTELSPSCFSGIGITWFSSGWFPNVTSCGDSCFSDCLDLESVSVSAGFPYNISMFSGCTSVVTFDNAALEVVMAGLFRDYNSLRTVTIPACVEIRIMGFRGCPSLETVVAGNVETVETQAFMASSSSSSALAEVHLDNVRSMGSAVFQNCANLAHVYMTRRSYMQLIGKPAFGPVLSHFPWSAPAGCVFHCRDGEITMTSEAGASTPTYTVHETSSPEYDPDYDDQP